MSEKYHWYNYCFINNDMIASEHFAHTSNAINMKNIETAKSNMKIQEDAVLIAVSYLGHMTVIEFEGNSTQPEG